jgi:hypothetical protein
MKTVHMLVLAIALGHLSTPRASSQTNFATIYTFNGSELGGLTAGNGVLYGASTAGVCGSIAALRPPIAPGGTWTEGTVYAFTGANGDGCGPVSPPAIAANGAMYGATSNGGAYRGGTIYELQPPAAPGGAWIESVLYS